MAYSLLQGEYAIIIVAVRLVPARRDWSPHSSRRGRSPGNVSRWGVGPVAG
jgi:hypothetical protein